MRGGQSAEIAALGKVTFTCEWCGGRFAYEPNLMGADLGVRISVERINDECVRHSARVEELSTPSAQTTTEVTS